MSEQAALLCKLPATPLDHCVYLEREMMDSEVFSKAEIKKDLEHFLPVPGRDPRAHVTRTEGCQKAISGQPAHLLPHDKVH